MLKQVLLQKSDPKFDSEWFHCTVNSSLVYEQVPFLSSNYFWEKGEKFYQIIVAEKVYDDVICFELTLDSCAKVQGGVYTHLYKRYDVFRKTQFSLSLKRSSSIIQPSHFLSTVVIKFMALSMGVGEILIHSMNVYSSRICNAGALNLIDSLLTVHVIQI